MPENTDPGVSLFTKSKYFIRHGESPGFASEQERQQWKENLIEQHRSQGLGHLVITRREQLEGAAPGCTIRSFEDACGTVGVLTLQGSAWYGAWDWKSPLPVEEYLPALLLCT